MKRILLLVTTVLFALAVPLPLCAYEYENAELKFTIPDDYTVSPVEGQGFSGFTASRGTEQLTLYNLVFDEQIEFKYCLKQPDSKWLPALVNLQTIGSERPFWKTYDLVSTYKNGDKGYVRIYRYVSGNNVCLLVAGSSENDWQAVDSVAESLHFKKSFGHLWYRIQSRWSTVFMWILMVVAAATIVVNICRKFRRRRFMLYLVLIAGAGVGVAYWEPWGVSGKLVLILTLFATSVYSFSFGSDDDDYGDGDDDGGDNGRHFDGTGTTIDHNF